LPTPIDLPRREEVPTVAAPQMPPAPQPGGVSSDELPEAAAPPMPLSGNKRTPAEPSEVDASPAPTPLVTAPPATPAPQPAAVPVAPTSPDRADTPAIAELPVQDVGLPTVPPTALPNRAEAPPMPAATPEVPPMPSAAGTTPARIPAAAQTPPAAPAPMPSFPAVDDDPFAPPPPASRAKSPVTQPDDTPLPAVEPTPSESTSPARQPSQPTPADDDPFAPARPQANLTPRQVGSAMAASDLKNSDADLARDANGRLPLRTWVDDTGQFRVQARLIQVLDGRVRLLKTTGRTTTVPLSRLSTADRAYVAQAVARYGQQLVAPQLAARPAGQP